MALFFVLSGFLACTVTALALGVAAVRLLRLEMDRSETVCLSYVLGSALASMVTLALAVLWAARWQVFLVLTAGSLVFLVTQAAWFRGLRAVAAGTIPAAWRVVFAVAWLAYGILYFRQAVSPEMSPDGMTYHLGLVNLWNHAHGLPRNVTVFAALPDGIEMLFLYAFAIGRHSAAALVHFSFLMLLPGLMVLYGRRFGWPGGGAVLAALLVFASPLIGVDGASAYNDVALAVVVFAALYLLALWRQAQSQSCLWASAFLAGFAFAIKYTAGFFAIFVLLIVVAELRRTPKRAVRATLVAAAVMAICPAPYLVRNVIWFQNPIAFFGNRLFPNRWFHVSFEQAYTRNMANPGGVTWAELPRELTVGGDKLHESFGPAFALLPLGLLGLAWPRSRFLVLAAVFVSGSFVADKSARFLIPAAPLIAMSAGFVLCRMPRSTLVAIPLVVAHLVVSWPTVNNRFRISSGWRIAYHIPWTVALRIQPEPQYLRKLDEYLAAQMIESHVPEGQPVLVFDDWVAQSYTTRLILGTWVSAFAERMTDLVQQASNSPGAGRTWTVRFPKSRVKGLRIIQTGPPAEDAMWSINEVRLWNGEAAVQPKPGWQFNADPNPWDLPLAIDGNESTRWRSWAARRPGMWMEIRFDSALTVDRADLVCDDAQLGSQMQALVLTDAGQWTAAAGVSSWRPSPFPDLRKQAVQELKRSGIQYLDVSREAWEKGVFQGDYGAWGVRQVDSTAHSLLLKIE